MFYRLMDIEYSIYPVFNLIPPKKEVESSHSAHTEDSAPALLWRSVQISNFLRLKSEGQTHMGNLCYSYTEKPSQAVSLPILNHNSRTFWN